ncbi:hypothetical protein SARC_11138, partial [Sphaeroforma arctica JP610]
AELIQNKVVRMAKSTDALVLWLPGASGTTSKGALQLHAYMSTHYNVRVTRLDDHHNGRVPWKKGNVGCMENIRLITDCVGSLKGVDSDNLPVYLCGASFGGRVALEVIAHAYSHTGKEKHLTDFKQKKDLTSDGWDVDMHEHTKNLANAGILCGYPLYPPGAALPEVNSKRDRIRHLQAVSCAATRLLFVTGDADEFVTRAYLDSNNTGPEGLEKVVRKVSKAQSTFHVVPKGKHSVPDCGGGIAVQESVVESVALVIARFIGAHVRSDKEIVNDTVHAKTQTGVDVNVDVARYIGDKKVASDNQTATSGPNEEPKDKSDTPARKQTGKKQITGKRKGNQPNSSKQAEVDRVETSIRTAENGEGDRNHTETSRAVKRKPAAAEMVTRSGRPVRQCRR